MPSGEEKPAVNILVVDDDHSVGQMISEFLSRQGYPATLCTDPNKALEMCEGMLFSLAFIDIQMPGMNGLELASGLKNKLPLR